jgi:hypothetical protein
MTSTIKVNNLQNQCGGAVVTKCGATTTISGSVVKADDIQAADGGNLINQCGTTITLGASGDTINLASGASQTGFGRTGTVDWDTTAKTASFTAVSGDGYFVNTTSGAITVTLPAGSAGDIVSLKDYANTWQTNNVTVTPNGTDKINGTNGDATLSTEDQSVTLVYVDSTKGWRVVQDSTSDVSGRSFITATGGTETTSPCGDYKIHTFTGPGTFCVSTISTVAAENTVGYLVVAGGGGGSDTLGGAGGAGGFREGRNVPIDNFTASPLVANSPTNAVTLTAQGYAITIGGGGTGATEPGTSGSNSIFSTITSAGGGGGGRGAGSPGAGLNGGSGGGGHGEGLPGGGAAGSGNTPPVSPPQGQNGGPSASLSTQGGGGGGATGTGGSASGGIGSGSAGVGGTGTSTSISGSSTAYAGGGGGGGYNPTPGGAGSPCGTGGSGVFPPVSGTVNTGGGGGGSSFAHPTVLDGGTGGSGIVIIRYKFQ